MRYRLFGYLVLGSLLLYGCRNDAGGGNTGGAGLAGTVGSLGGSAGSGVGGSAGTSGTGRGGTLGGAGSGSVDAGSVGGSGSVDAGSGGGAGSVDGGGVGGVGSVDAGSVGGSGSVDVGSVGGAGSVDAGSVGGAGSGGSHVGGAAGSSAGGSGGAGTSGGRGCDTDLSGTWDLVATRSYDSARSGSLVIAPESLTITVHARTLWYSGQGTPTAVWQRTSERIQPIDVTRAPVALSAGSIPIGLGGDWQFSASGITCKSSVAAANATASCNARPTGFLWPYDAIPRPAPNVTYQMTQTAELSSQFGFLGGEWNGTSAASTDGCTMRVEGKTIQLSCRTGSVWNGSANLTVGSDCVASGLTTTGYELSARKR